MINIIDEITTINDSGRRPNRVETRRTENQDKREKKYVLLNTTT